MSEHRALLQDAEREQELQEKREGYFAQDWEQVCSEFGSHPIKVAFMTMVQWAAHCPWWQNVSTNAEMEPWMETVREIQACQEAELREEEASQGYELQRTQSPTLSEVSGAIWDRLDVVCML